MTKEEWKNAKKSTRLRLLSFFPACFGERDFLFLKSDIEDQADIRDFGASQILKDGNQV